MLEKKMFINEETGAYYGVQNNEEFGSLTLDVVLGEENVFIADYVEKAADYIKEIFDELSPVNKLRLFLFVEKQNTKRSSYFIPETMVSLMEKYADEWCSDDEITPLEFVNKDQEEFLAWAEDYVEDWFPDSFTPDYRDLNETIEYLESIEKNFMYTTITGYSQGEFYYCFKLLNDSVEEKKYFEDLFASDYLHDALCETGVTIYASDNEGGFIEPILDTVGYVGSDESHIEYKEIDSYMEKKFNARPVLIEYV